ncbi:MAG: tetratricopeptide repeat protein [Candidatus Polarisedimenticolia bacterium]
MKWTGRGLRAAVLAAALPAAVVSCGTRMDEARREALLDEGDLALAGGRLADAEEAFSRLHRAFPEDPRAAFGLGLSRLRQGRSADAVRPFQTAVRLDPDNVDRAYALALALDAAGRTDESMESFAALVQKHPDHRQSAAGYIDSLRKAGRTEEANDAAARAAERWPRSAEFAMQAGDASLRAGDAATALRQYEMARRAHPWDPRTLRALAEALRMLGRPEEAKMLEPMQAELSRREEQVQALVREVEAAPGDVMRARGLAQRLFEEGRLEDAIARTEDYLRRFPKDEFGGALALRAAQASALFGDEEGARRLVEKAHTGERSTAERVAAAEVYATLGDYEAAFSAFEVLLLDRPDHPAVLLGLGRMAMRTDRLERAEPALRRAAQLSPDSAPAQAALALLLIKKLEPVAASKAIDKALAIDPNLTEALFGRGLLLHQAGRLPEAEVFLEKTIQTDPSHATARAILAMVLADQGKCEEAIPLFTRALQEDYKSMILHAGLVRCYERTGRMAEAEAERAIARQLEAAAPSR